MNEWKGPTIQVIGIILSSSVILGFVNNFISIMNQPEIKASIISDYSFIRHIVEDYSIPDYMNVTYQINIRNVGESPATNVNLLLKFSDNAKITNFHFLSAENQTTQILEPNQMSSYLKKLGPGGGISIDADVQVYNISHLFSKSYLYPEDPKDLTDCVITISYDQNTNTFNCNTKVFSFDFFIPVLIFIIILILFSYIIISFKIKIYFNNKKKKDFILQIRNEIFNTFNTFSNNSLSRKILPYGTWNSLSENEKYKIFNNFDDYNKIDKLYENIKNRHNAFLVSDIDNETLEVYNNSCYKLSKNIIDIEWSKYYNKQTDEQPIPLILILLISAFSITLLESFLISNTNFLEYSGLSIYPPIGWFLIFSIRILISFFIIYLLVKKVLTKVTKYKIQSSNEPIFNQNNYSKFFAISVGIMGLPSLLPFFIISSFLHSIDYFPYFTLIAMVIDFWRMNISIRSITETSSPFRFNLKTSAILYLLSGILSISIFLYGLKDYFNPDFKPH